MPKLTLFEPYRLEISDQKIACYETRAVLFLLFPGALLMSGVGYLSLVNKHPAPVWFTLVFLASGILIFLNGLARLFGKTKVLVWSCDHENFECLDARARSQAGRAPTFVIPIRNVRKLVLADQCVCDSIDGEATFRNAIVAVVSFPEEQLSFVGRIGGSGSVVGFLHILLGLPKGRELEVESILRTRFLSDTTEFQRRSVFRF